VHASPPGPRPRKGKLKACLLVVCGLAVLAGCSTQKKEKWLTFFFDGVHSSRGTNSPAIVYDEDGRPLDQTPAVVRTNAVVKILFTAHPPYENKECTECHESRFSVKMKGPQRQVCFACHDDVEKKFMPAKVKHQPVENGECVSCHNPHGSANPKMLVQTGAKLCFTCHDDLEKQLAQARVKHQPVENGECASCHDSHQSDIKKLLLKPYGKLCFDCHENIEQALATAPFKHDPAANGECGACHSPHVSAEAGLLLKDRRQICFECHEEKDLAAVKAHAGTAQQSCVLCHDPHTGKDKFLLKPDASKLQPAPASVPAQPAKSGKEGGAK
jgi:predicted CXXCH cytochrome family protein